MVKRMIEGEKGCLRLFKTPSTYVTTSYGIRYAEGCMNVYLSILKTWGGRLVRIATLISPHFESRKSSSFDTKLWTLSRRRSKRVDFCLSR